LANNANRILQNSEWVQKLSAPEQGCQMLYFQTKIAVWVNFGGYCNRRCWYILWTVGQSYGHLIYFMTIWHSLWQFGTCIFAVLVCCTKKNLATLLQSWMQFNKQNSEPMVPLLRVFLFFNLRTPWRAMAAWRNGNRIRLRNRRPGFESR
jgi:hypothetical protein